MAPQRSDGLPVVSALRYKNQNVRQKKKKMSAFKYPETHRLRSRSRLAVRSLGVRLMRMDTLFHFFSPDHSARRHKGKRPPDYKL